MTLEDKIQKVRQLLKERDTVDVELAIYLGEAEKPVIRRRGRKPKTEQVQNGGGSKAAERKPRAKNLTSEEKDEIASLKAEGKTSGEIAAKLDLSLTTVNRYYA